jgi:hypothetical protein
MSYSVVSFDYPKMLAYLTGTRASSWHDASGPETGCGQDYFYSGPRGREAYINFDQEHLTIAVDGETLFAGDPKEDQVLKKYVTES